MVVGIGEGVVEMQLDYLKLLLLLVVLLVQVQEVGVVGGSAWVEEESLRSVFVGIGGGIVGVLMERLGTEVPEVPGA